MRSGIVWILLLLTPVSLGASGRAWNPYGLSEDEVDALRVRHPALREFAEFFTALLRHEDSPRDENLAVYRPIRRLAMRRRTVRGVWSPDSQDEIQGRVSQALWNLASPELARIDLDPDVHLKSPAQVSVFTEGLENRVLLLLRNNQRTPVTVSLNPDGVGSRDKAKRPPRQADAGATEHSVEVSSASQPLTAAKRRSTDGQIGGSHAPLARTDE